MAKSSTTYLDINGISKHLKATKPQNERNLGLGVTLEDLTANNLVKSLSAGGYKNSRGEPSFYVMGGLGKRFGGKTHLDLGMLAGGMTGYNETIRPAIMPYAAIGMKDLIKLRLMYGHRTKSSPAVLMMNLGIPFR